MSISFPITDILSSAFWADQTFRLVERQEISRSADGIPRVKSLGEAIWFASYVSVALERDDAIDLEAKLRALDGSINSFYAYDLRREYPRQYPSGVFADSGVIQTVNDNNKAISLSGLPAGFELSRGDYISWDYGFGPSRALHQIMENVTANGSGITAEFEVRPHIRPGISISPATPATLKHPSGLFVLEPGSLEVKFRDPMHNIISFSAVQLI